MKEKQRRAELRRHLEDRLRQLNQRAMVIEHELKKLDNRFYRVCIFGSARIKAGTPLYNDVVNLAACFSRDGMDILTGGGPGLMEAANFGALKGKDESHSQVRSIGLSIQLEREPIPNQHLDVKRHHFRFSSRLDDFMRLSNSFVVTPGGVGTALEFFFAWQLIQVGHMTPKPIVLLGKDFWHGLIDWIKTQPLGLGLLNAADLDTITIVDSTDAAHAIIAKDHKGFINKNGDSQEKSR